MKIDLKFVLFLPPKLAAVKRLLGVLVAILNSWAPSPYIEKKIWLTDRCFFSCVREIIGFVYIRRLPVPPRVCTQVWNCLCFLEAPDERMIKLKELQPHPDYNLSLLPVLVILLFRKHIGPINKRRRNVKIWLASSYKSINMYLTSRSE